MEDNIRLKLGRKIRELRRKSGYAQEKLADMAEIGYKTINLGDRTRKPGTVPLFRELSTVNCELNLVFNNKKSH